MGSLLQQETQIRRSLVADILDNVAPSEANFETNPVSLLDDLNNIRSQLNNLLQDQAGSWFDDLIVPSTLETGIQRGVNDLNTALHAVEKKRVLRDVHSLVDVTVGAGNNFVILGTGELPTQTTAAVGAVTTLGTVVAAHGGTFGTHALSEVSGPNAISPLNLMLIVDGASRDPILSGGRQVYGLLQGESGLVDGGTITDTTTTRVQISFVRLTATGDDLEAVPVADIENAVINYCTRERVRLEDLSEFDFLTGAIVDLPAGSVVTRQVGYDNQGTTPVDLLTNATLDLEGAGLVWAIRDDLEATLFSIVEGSAGGTSQVNIAADVDEFDIDAVVVDFLNGITVDSGSTGIDIGATTAGVIQRASDLRVSATGAGELILEDSNMINEGTWTGPGVKVSETTAEVAAYETTFGGEVSLFNALVQAYNAAHRRRVFAIVTADLAEDVDVSGPANDNNLDTNLGDLSGGTFVDDYDVYHNGQYLKLDAADAGTGDVYPGTSLANGQLRFNRKLKTGDILAVVDYIA